MAEQAFNWRPTIKRRVVVAAAVFASWTLAIEARLVYLQVVSHADLVGARRAAAACARITAPAKRGEIVDRRGRLLAYSVDADTIYAVPLEIETRRRPPPRCAARSRTAHAKDGGARSSG